MEEEKRRWTLAERFKNYPWMLSPSLFGNVEYDIYDFEAENYTHLLTCAPTVEVLIQGLCELSPLVDDALGVAEGMNEKDWQDFKHAHAQERRNAQHEPEAETVMPRLWFPLLIPESFIQAIPLARQCDITLGVALIRIASVKQ